MSWALRYRGTRCATVELPRIVGKARPRFTKVGRAYTPKDTKRAETAIARAWDRAHGKGLAGFDGVVWVDITVHRPLARSNPKGWEGRQDLSKPDCDNVAKLVCDALNGHAFKDDQQVTRLHVDKAPRPAHGTKPAIAITVTYWREEKET